MFRSPSDPDQFRISVGRFGDRHYYDPLPADDVWEMDDPEGDPYPSVSTIKKVTSRDFSETAARRVAEFALDNDAWRTLPRDAALDLLTGANRRGLNSAGNRGTAVHGVMENLAAGRWSMLHIDPSAEPYLEACKAIMHDLAPVFEYNEVVAISRSGRYGGTLDCILQIQGKRYLVDWKSRKAGGHAAYIEEGWQVGAYAKADYLIVQGDDGQARRVPVPPLDGGLIVSICPGQDSYKIYPVDLDKGYDGFLRMRALWEAKNIQMWKPVGRPIELAPRTYVPEIAVVTAPADIDVSRLNTTPGPIEEWDPFAGLPQQGNTSDPLTKAVTAARSPVPAYDDDCEHAEINDYVLVTWVEIMHEDGRALEAEQRLEGWLRGIDSHGTVVIADMHGNEQGIPGVRRPEVAKIDPPKPAGVLPIANPVEDGAVAPLAVEAPPVRAQAPRTSPISDGGGDGDPEIRAWLRRRLHADVEQLGGQSAVIKYWPAGVKVLDEAGVNQHSKADLEAIEAALMSLERDMQLPLGETKPSTNVEGEEASVKEDPPFVESAKPAHPDDVAVMLQRLLNTAEEWPITFKVIEAKAKAAGVPNLKTGRVTAEHLITLDDLITEQIAMVRGRLENIKAMLEAVPNMMGLAIEFASSVIVGDNEMYEPNENEELRIKLLTDAAIMGKITVREEEGEEYLEATDEYVAEVRKIYPDTAKLYRAVNPHLQKCGFNSISKVSELRRACVGLVLAMHEAHEREQE